jgi:EAL domain-containing protein (putative c-di-GMP-specific phosphodiesterase class I)
LLEHDLVQDIKAILARHSVRRGSLRLEITENGVMDNPEYASRVLSRLAENGIGLVLDDFGTGYSSLSYLQRFPFDIMKISRALLRPDASGQRPAILRSVVGLAQDLGMTVVADGLDSEEDADALRAVGCEYGQGLIIGPPMTAAQTRALLGVSAQA